MSDQGMRTPQQYDFAQRLSDLCGAWDSQRRPIAAEILGQIARIAEARDGLVESLELIAREEPGIGIKTVRKMARSVLLGVQRG